MKIKWILTVLILLSISFVSAYDVNTWADLQAMPSTGVIFLKADLDSSSPGYAGTGSNFQPIANFAGDFRGKGYTISDLVITQLGVTNVGLFKNTLAGATITDLKLEDVNVNGGMNVGALVGVNAGTITKSSVTGTVQSTVGARQRIGGMVGQNSGTIQDSYTQAIVSGGNIVGGVVGFNIGPVTNSYAAGTTTVNAGPWAGGIFGQWTGGTVTSTYWDSSLDPGTCAGSPPVVAGCTAKTTVQMQQQATFAGWGFGSIWDIVEDTTYPYHLREKGFLPEINWTSILVLIIVGLIAAAMLRKK